MTVPLSTLTVEPDPQGLFAGDRDEPAHFVTLTTACIGPQYGRPFTVRYEAVRAERVAAAAAILLRAHRQHANCTCCAELERRYLHSEVPA